MRRIVPAVLCGTLLLFLCACGKGGAPSTPPAFPERFSADAAVCMGEYTILSHIDYAPDDMELTFQSPEALKKLTLKCAGGTCSVAYDGLSLNLDIGKLPQAAFARVIDQAMIQCLSGAGVTTEFTGIEWIYKGETGLGAFELAQDPDTGALLRISCPDDELTIDFSNIQAE